MRKKRKLSKHVRPYRPLLEHLEDRRVLATFTEVGSLLDIDLDEIGDYLTVKATPSGYELELGNSYWNGNDSNTATGADLQKLTINADANSDLESIQIRDSAANTNVEFIDSGTNSYIDDVSIEFDHAGSGEVIFVGASRFVGDNQLTIDTNRNVKFHDGSILTAHNGDINIHANTQADASTGDFHGVRLNGATLRMTGDGDIHLEGRGGDDSYTDQIGIYISSESVVSSEELGGISITGYASESAYGSWGVAINTEAQVTTNNGDLIIHGTGGDNGVERESHGVAIYRGGVVKAVGAGNIELVGVGGQSTLDYNNGVYITHSDTVVSTESGALAINGTAGGSGASKDNHGVLIGDSGDANGGAQLFASGGGITIVGTGGIANGGGSPGVAIHNQGVVSTINGDIQLIGQGGISQNPLSNSENNRGTEIDRGAVRATGSGDIKISGLGGNASNFNSGVYIHGTSGQVSVENGNLHIEGTGGGTDDAGFNDGVYVRNGATISSAGDGSINIIGLGGQSSGPENRGIHIDDDVSITATGDGGLHINGTGGLGSVSGTGVRISDSSSLTSATADIYIEGHGKGDANSNNNYGVSVRSDALVSTTTGNIHVSGTGGFTSGDDNTGVKIWHDSIVTTVDGDISVVGHSGGDVESLTSGGVGSYIASRLTATGNGNVMIEGTGRATGTSSDGVVISGGNALVSTNSGTLHVDGKGGESTDKWNRGVGIWNGSKVTTATGEIQINGIAGGKHESYSNRGVQIAQGQIEATATGNITIRGNGGIADGGGNVAVAVEAAGGLIRAKDGDIIVHGNAGAMREGGGNQGIGVWSEGRIESIGVGNVHLIGVGAKSDGNYNHGIQIAHEDAGISVTNGGIVIEGHGGGVGKNSHGNDGVLIRDKAQLDASGSGDIHINSHGGLSQGNYNVGFVSRNGADIATNSGNITIQAFTGQGSAAPAATIADQGIESTITTGSGQISIRSDSIKLTQMGTVETGPNGSVVISPMTEGRTIELGVPDIEYSNLSLSNLSLSRVSTSHLQIGSSRTGEISITEPIILPSKTDVTITSPKAIQAMDGSLDTNGGSLVLNGNSTGHIKLLSHRTDLISATTTLEAGTHFAATINGTDVDTLYTQANLIGAIDISGAVLTINGGYTPSLGDVFTIINNDGDDSITGTFADLPEGSHVSLNNVPLKISYLGGTGNDVTLTAVSISPSIDPITDITIHENDGLQSISLTGIAPGSTDNSPVRVTAESQNTLLVSTVETVYTSPQTTGLLKFQPLADMAGSTVITVTVEDGGLDEDLSTTADNAEAQVQFNVRVLEAHPWHNYNFPEDVNGDGQVTPVDALSIINEINQGGAGVLPENRNEIAPPFYDVNKDGNLSPLDALIVINHINTEDYMMSIDVTFTNVSGHTLSEVEVGSVFYLTLSSTDLSEENEGVFAAYADVYYDTTMVSAAGVAQFISPYVNGKHVDTAVAGILDEWGAFGGIEPSDSSRVVISSIPMRAERVGQALFGMDAADESPLHDPLLFGVMDAIPIDAVRFGSATLDIVEATEGEYLESVDSVFKDYD